jgi:hypothetical protein
VIADSRDGLHAALARDARALRGDQRTPIDLNLIARRLGLSVEWGSSRLSSAEGGLFKGRNSWTVAVADGDPRRPRTRFTLAHEMGHYMLETYGVPRPAGRGEYWRTEALCHHFAGHLLIPDAAVHWVGDGAGSGPSELLRRSAKVSHQALVSPQALSHRLNQDLSFCAFCEVKLASPRRGVVGVVDWIIERFSWLGLRARNYVESDHFIAGPLAVHRRLPPGEVQAGFLNGLPVAALRRRHSVWMLGVEPALAGQPTAASPQLPLPFTCNDLAPTL